MGIGRNFTSLAIATVAALTACADADGQSWSVPAPASPAVTPFMGMAPDIVEVDPALGQGLTSGARIDFIYPGSPAEIAGVREGDIVLSVNGNAVSSDEDFVSVVLGLRVGAIVPILLIRAGGRQTINLKVGEQPANYLSRNGPLKQVYIARIQNEQRSAADAEMTGDNQTAFRHYVEALRILDREGAIGVDIGPIWTDSVVHLSRTVPKLKPAPAIPVDADRHNRRAIALLRSAASDEDYDRAAREFDLAIYEAPWIADLYLNLGVTDAKAGNPEGAISSLRRYLILSPNARDAASVTQKITELELLAEERKPWLPVLGVKSWQDGAAVMVSLRERKFEVRVFNTVGANQKARPGELILTGTIHGRQFQGKSFIRPLEPNAMTNTSHSESLVRCFGREYSLDAQGAVVDEVDGTYFRWRQKSFNYTMASCVVNSESWLDGVAFKGPKNP